MSFHREKSSDILRADRMHIVGINPHIKPPDAFFQVLIIIILMVMLMAVKLYGPAEISIPFLYGIMEQDEFLILPGQLMKV